MVPHLYLPKRQLEIEERVQDLVREVLKHDADADVEEIRRKLVVFVTAEMIKHAKAHGVALELRPPKRMAAVNFVNGLQVAFEQHHRQGPACRCTGCRHDRNTRPVRPGGAAMSRPDDGSR